MRKITILLFIFTLLLGLISCKPAVPTVLEPEDITVQVFSETVVGQVISVHVVLGVELSTLDELLEITLSIASQTYEKHFEMIDGRQFTLRVYLYASEAHFTANNNTYGYHNFNINQTLENPGLSLGTNALKLA
ncbi:MAG: hypothetical protein Q7I99_02970 [Acholeplasmataceae bacterium]|nr:hypothetical protein [Acholeplasmataceae bacterium]